MSPKDRAGAVFVTETLSLRNIPESLRKKCVEHGILSKSLLLQIARQPTEKK